MNPADRITLHPGDCLEVLPTLAECSIDSCVTDPPYHLTSIVKRFGANGAAPVQGSGVYKRSSAGFMGKQWDGGDIAFRPEVWREVYRVLKPGAHLLAFGGTRTYHRMACAIEDAGFEIRDCVMWIYGSGFPKSHDVSKGIDRAAGVERKVIGVEKLTGTARKSTSHNGHGAGAVNASDPRDYIETFKSITMPATAAAAAWHGWGTALKPACEPIVVARKPLSEDTIAANVLRWGTGAVNIDGCRVGVDGGCAGAGAGAFIYGDGLNGTFAKPVPGLGRWPANVVHDGSAEVVAGFPQSEASDGVFRRKATPGVNSTVNIAGRSEEIAGVGYADSGSAARFFYTAKADSDDRIGSKHPTVKPLDLMQWLVRLVTPRGGTVLDPFGGTGTTGEAAFREGCNAVLIEREAEYQADIRRRINLMLAGPDERTVSAIKAKNLPYDAGPLFGGGSHSPVTGRQIYGEFADENGRRK